MFKPLLTDVMVDFSPLLNIFIIGLMVIRLPDVDVLQVY